MLRSAILLLSSKDEQIEVLRYELWAAEVELQKRIEADAHKEPTIQMSNQPLYLSEEQEDVQWQLDNDMINKETAQALLKELEFENAEVQLADEYTYENFHY